MKCSFLPVEIPLQDFYLDLVEDNRRITPRDYLELALRPVQGTGRDIAAKNEVFVVVLLIVTCLKSPGLSSGKICLIHRKDEVC